MPATIAHDGFDEGSDLLELAQGLIGSGQLVEMDVGAYQRIQLPHVVGSV